MRLLRMLSRTLGVIFQYLENYPLGLDMLDITNLLYTSVTRMSIASFILNFNTIYRGEWSTSCPGHFTPGEGTFSIH